MTEAYCGSALNGLYSVSNLPLGRYIFQVNFYDKPDGNVFFFLQNISGDSTYCKYYSIATVIIAISGFYGIN